jgi:hypothetical protein
MSETTFVENAYGVKVKRCCASCKYKKMTRLVKTRRCRKHLANVYPYNVCKDWEMSETLKNFVLN